MLKCQVRYVTTKMTYNEAHPMVDRDHMINDITPRDLGTAESTEVPGVSIFIS